MSLPHGWAGPTPVPTDAELEARLAPVFERISARAAARPRDGGSLHAEVGWLRDAGFTALRVPVALGGLGARLGPLVDLLTDLAAAEPDLPESLQWHLSFVEDRLGEGDDPAARQWLRRIGAGLIIGRAVPETARPHAGGSEAAGPVASEPILRGDGAGRLRLNGRERLGAGSRYAGAVAVSAWDDDGQRVLVVVPAGRAGVELLAGGAGMAPRPADGGTAVLADVVVRPDEILPALGGDRPGRVAFGQLIRLAGLAGVARRAADDAVELVRRRGTAGPGVGRPAGATPGPASSGRDDPARQQTVGKAEAAAFAARAAVRAATASLEAALEARDAGRPDAVRQLRAAEADVSRAEVVVVDLVLRATTDLLAVGASPTSGGDRSLDRHWRQARTLALGHPVDAAQRAVGAYLLNGRDDRDAGPPLRSPFPAVRSLTPTPPEASGSS
ncbi:MAG TPA: hypothetical protein VKV06_06045 [Acidimicrobiales bacterium]|nr:hypothetical protein [Acidimicrobiales bacterium]